MNSKRRWIFTVATVLLLALTTCSNQQSAHTPGITTTTSVGEIYLYGENHGVESILNQELKLWQAHYHEDGLRHLAISLWSCPITRRSF